MTNSTENTAFGDPGAIAPQEVRPIYSTNVYQILFYND